MENFILWVFDSFYYIIQTLVEKTVYTILNIPLYLDGQNLFGTVINLSLFSDTPILTTNLFELLMIFFSIFYTVIFVIIVWKIIKKVFTKITRWNKW